MAILYDAFGREIQVMKRPETREIAVTTVRDRWSNYPSGGLTPRSRAPRFKEPDQRDCLRQAELFEEMEEKDTHRFSELQTRKNAVLGLGYDIAPLSESASDKKDPGFCRRLPFRSGFIERSSWTPGRRGKRYSYA
jgi:phage gp29-like protein